jgi:lipopolysaccharide biosynthesis glycosyltransferase
MSLWTIDMQGASLGAVTLATVRWSNDSEFLSSNGVEVDAAYFNSGVLLVDCEMWRNQSITSTLRSLLAAHGPSLRVVDQTLLNLHFHSSFFHLPPKWNRHICANQALPELGPGILHFLGQPKPWNFVGGQFHPARKTYKHIVKKQQMSIPALSWAEFTRSPRVIVKSLRSIYRAAYANFKHRSP